MAASASDAHAYCIYNARFRVTFPILDADGDLVTGAASLDSEASQNQGTFADCTNEATEIATSSGMYYLDLIATELDTQQTAIIVKTATAGAKTTPMVLYPRRLPVIRTGTAQAGAASTITLDSGASAIDDYYIGCFVNITNDTPSNVLGQARKIVAYVGSTKVATVEGTYGTNPSSSSTFEILGTEEWAWRLADLRASGGVAVTTAGGRPEINVKEWLGTTAATPTVAGVPEVDVTHLNGVAQSLLDLKDFADDGYDPATNKVQGVVIVDAVTVVNGLAAGVITATAIATDAIDADALATDAVQEIVDGVWDEAIAGHLGAGSTGAALNAAGSAGDPWGTNLPGLYVAGTAGHIVGTALPDIAPGSANGLLRGGTNAATSITTALTANLIGNITGNLSGSVGSVTGAVGSVTGAVGSVTGAVGSVTGNVGGNVTGSVGSVLGNVGGNVVGSTASVTAPVTVGTNNDKTGYALSSAGVQAVWDALTSALTTLGSIGKLLVDNINATISSRSSHTAADVWLSLTRTLTSAANITSTGGTTVPQTGDAYAQTVLIKAKTDNLPEGIQKNAALANFEFLMVAAADHVTGMTGLTVTAERSIDGAAFGACANAVTEIANGLYKINLAAADTNGTVITYRFSAATADDTLITVKTEV